MITPNNDVVLRSLEIVTPVTNRIDDCEKLSIMGIVILLHREALNPKNRSRV